MNRQRNTLQIKEQDKCPPNQTKEEEIGNLPDKEFQIMIVRKLKGESARKETGTERKALKSLALA